jgi:myo-inositol 2-dehydrogenase / D-chiro-inositol 1-dehydrogenase
LNKYDYQKKMNMKRREFIEKTSFSIAAIGIPTIVPASVFGKNAPSNRITVGIIGTGRQGVGVNLQGAGLNIGGVQARNLGFLEVKEAQVVAVCDTDSWRMEKAKNIAEEFYAKQNAKGSFKGVATYADFREIIQKKDIDAVLIATPDHWHIPMGILAAKAKKHFTCEKPLSMSVHQGRDLVNVLKKYPVINRTDSECKTWR